MTNNKKKIILIDGNSLMYRSYFATAYTGFLMQNKQGIYTNAIFGFCNMLEKLLDEDKTNIFVAFDAGKQTFRHQSFQDYKGTRKTTPDELKMQIPYIKEYLDILNIKRRELDDYEADDLIASVATLAQKEGFDEIKVITGDKDLLQMVGGNIKVYLTKKGVTELEEYNEKNFFEKMGFFPHQVVDYKGLVGDTSDNLPGIKGIGEKTAVKLLTDYHTLEGILEHVGEIKGKMQEKILEGKEMGLECKRLATLERHIDLDFSLEDTIVRPYDEVRLIKFYKDLDFDSFLQRIQTTKETTSMEAKIVDDASYDFSKVEEVYLVPEVFGSNYYTGEFLGLGMLCDDESIYVTLNALQKNATLHQMLEDKNVRKSTFDLKKLYVSLRRIGIELAGVDFDLLLAAYLINPQIANEDFKKVCDEFVVTDIQTDDGLYGAKSKAQIPSESDLASNAAKKAWVLEQAKPIALSRLREFELEYLFNVELELSIVLGNVELAGLKVNREKLRQVEVELSAKQKEIEEQIYVLAGESFNINSVKQLGEILFEKLGLPHGKKNKTGFSTNSDVLEKLIKVHPIAALVLEYRGISKLISTYVNGLFEVMNDEDYVHPLYKQALTVTGRLSSIEPNIQNIPIRTEMGQVIREIFVSRFENGVIMSSDYSQIELRVLAHIADDEAMIDMFNNHVDFHTQTAQQMYEVGLEAVTKDMRRAAKAINFGIIYGMSAWGLSESIDISPLEANIYINKYFDTFKKVKSYLDGVIAEAKKNGYTKTLFNRRRYLPEILSENKALAAFGERTAMNSPIQGSAADIIKLAMNAVFEKMKSMKSVMIAQVHDELLFDVHPDEIEAMEKLIKETMESVTTLKVPLVVEVGYGKNWLDA